MKTVIIKNVTLWSSDVVPAERGFHYCEVEGAEIIHVIEEHGYVVRAENRTIEASKCFNNSKAILFICESVHLGGRKGCSR